ncbi:unnamed protein product [Camellia sinensis]
MKEYQLQTPKKEHQHSKIRRSKSISEHSKKPHINSQKCLNSVFTSVSEDLIEFSSISEISEDNQLREFTESFIASPNQVISPSLETFSLSDLTPLSSTITVDKDEVVDVSVSHCRSAESKKSADIVSVEAEVVANHLKQALVDVSVSHCRSAESKKSADIVSVEAEVVVNHLKQARIQVMNSTNADLQSKKLLNALIEVVIEEFNALPEEKDRSRGQSSFGELRPT